MSGATAVSTPAARLAPLAGPTEVLGWVAALIGATVLRLQNLGAYTGSFDEGIRSEQLLLMSAGYRPFRDIFASQGPLLLDLLFPFFVAFGQSLEAVRFGVVVTSIVALLGGAWVARLVMGPVAALATIVLLGLSPAFLESSRLALAETPSLAPAVWAVGAGLRYEQNGRRGWLISAAVLLALAVLVKPMVAPAALAVLLAVALRRPFSTRDLVLFGAVSALVCAVVVIALGPAGVYEDLAAYRGGATRSLGRDAAENWRLTVNVVSRDRLALVALAGAGALALLTAPRRVIPVLAWPVAVLAMFMTYDDLADKHIVYLTFPLALLAGIGVGAVTHALAEVSRGQRWPELAVFIIGLIPLVAYLADLQRVWRADHFIVYESAAVAARRRDVDAEIEMADLIARVTGRDEFVLTDNPNAAFRARRLVPPKLVDTSGTRIDAGSLTDALAISTAERYRPTVVITSPLRMGKLGGFVRWLSEDRYRLVRTYGDNAWRVYVRSDLIGGASVYSVRGTHRQCLARGRGGTSHCGGSEWQLHVDGGAQAAAGALRPDPSTL